ncbi:class I SAM-dependent methyltransferase [Agrobacterium tumefaciens]|nr:class I SAM-dependent methyltransferase [Agrobacterium tumefaciens]
MARNINDTSKIQELFPVGSQTSDSDKLFLLNIINLLSETTGRFSYLEIGSFLGGTIAPFLVSKDCEYVLSVDERERQQPDERGPRYDYAGITSQTMVDNLKNHGLPTEKLKTFDGSINALPLSERRFDLAFIDAEHTDEAVFRDFVYLLDHMKRDSIVMFHDSSLTAKGIANIITLEQQKRHGRKSGIARVLAGQKKIGSFKFFKKRDSEMSCILFGKYSHLNVPSFLGDQEPTEVYMERAARYILEQKIIHQVEFEGSYKILDTRVLKAY